MNDDDTPRPGDRFAAARVIAFQAQELSELAKRHGLESLSYTLTLAAMMARDECGTKGGKSA